MLMCELEPMEYAITMEDKMLNENEGESKMVAHDFLDDEEKMKDFDMMSKEEFLKSYSYLTEEEYDLTEERYHMERHMGSHMENENEKENERRK